MKLCHSCLRTHRTCRVRGSAGCCCTRWRCTTFFRIADILAFRKAHVLDKTTAELRSSYLEVTVSGQDSDGRDQFSYRADCAGEGLRQCCQTFYCRVLWQLNEDTARRYESAGMQDRYHIHRRVFAPQQDPRGYRKQARDFWHFFVDKHTADVNGKRRLPFHATKAQVRCASFSCPRRSCLQLYNQYFLPWVGGAAPGCQAAPQREVMKVLMEDFPDVCTHAVMPPSHFVAGHNPFEQ